MISGLVPLPKVDQTDPTSIRLNQRATELNFKKIVAAVLVELAQGGLQKFSIDEDLDIPAGWYSQMIDPVVETGVTVTVEAGGLWFLDA